jgi:NAD-dependent DNA ligase
MANKIYRGIQDKLKEASIITLMASSNIFGRGFSEKKIELILNELPNILVLNNSKEEIIQLVASIKGMATKSAEAFVSKITGFKDFLVKCGLEQKLILHDNSNKKSAIKTHILFGKSVILTGTRDKNIIEFLKNVGANQGSSVSKNTFLVIAKNNSENTGKIEEARKLNIPIISVDEFTQTYF